MANTQVKTQSVTLPAATQGKSRKRSVWASPMRRREAIDGFVFIMPWLLGFLIFTFWPFIAGFYYSLTEFDVLTPPQWVGFGNYQAIFHDPKAWLAVGNTLWFVVFSVLPANIIALLLALLLNLKVRGITIFRTLFYIPSIVPAVASIALFIYIMHDRFGLLNDFLFRVFGITGPGWLTSPVWAKPSLVLWSLWGVGGSMIIYLAGLQGIPQQLYEAAEIDGAGMFRRFWHITIPMVSPTILFVFTLTVIGSFQIFTPVLLLGGNYAMANAGPMDSLLFWVVYIYHQGFFYFQMGYGSALAWLLFIVLVVVTVTQFKVADRWVYYEGDTRQ